ncbi:phosphotransferase family protein [Streptomyces paludis]|uniref:Aminoglycoside phosphotransferase family protein n=1 Tax=Streptomyces paludis TaxID=2282738 RepID=A0A345HRE9_9ACTN|nr:aminoglycoside phosphotransferase family protein [Streptomyces paludis]AXG79273.1 aminoglycoside phosphotransferase family protein [Streptomyces paludis]
MESPLLFSEKLRAELGSPRNARRLTSSPRSRVWQAELSGTPVVVKQLIEGPEAADRYAREATALRLASRVEPPVVPTLLGTDPVERMLVLEYVEHRPPADDWVVDYAEALARLHAANTPATTTAKATTTATTAATTVLPQWSGPTHEDVESFLGLARTLGCSVSSGVRTALADLVDRLARPPGRPALLHGDPCPGNDLHTSSAGGGIRFIDFEQAALGDGLMELAYLRIGFPTCWCVTAPAEPLLDAAEAAYRTSWRHATGTEAGGNLTDACAGWLIRGDALVQRTYRGATDHLAKIPHEDWQWGTATARQRLVHRLGVIGGMATNGSELEELGRLARTLRESMLTHWPTLQPVPSQRP